MTQDANAGAAGAGTGDAAAAAAATAAAAAAASAAAAKPAWHGFTEAADVDYVKTKGWQGPQDAIKSYRGAEKLIGRDPSTLIPLPRGDDAEGLRAALGKLGLPETADKYEFAKPPEGMTPDENYVKWARGTFHKAGLLPGQVKDLTAAHNEYVKGLIDKQTSDYNVQVEIDKKSLLAEWRGGHERMLSAAKTAATSLGFTPEMIDGMERTAGYAGTWKFFAALGQKLGEDGFSTGGNKRPGFDGQLTPAEAKNQWEAMKVDDKAMAALKDNQHPGHAAATKKKSDLFKIMYPAA